MARPIVGHWTYSGDPNTSDRDRVRFLIGDVDANDPLVSDEEITDSVTDRQNIYAAAAEICDSIAAFFAREAATSVNVAGIGQHITQGLNERTKAYSALAARLQKRASNNAKPYAGGISISDKEIDDDNTDLIRSGFSRAQFDNV